MTDDRATAEAASGMIFVNFNHKMVHSGVFFILPCAANWLDVEGLNIEVGALYLLRIRTVVRQLSVFVKQVGLQCC